MPPGSGTRTWCSRAEALGYHSTLIAQHTANPYDDDWDEIEAWTAAAGLAALTQRIEIIAAIKPPLYHPVVLAKMALQIQHIAQGRFGINLVNAWNRPEYDKAGIPFAEHDERYAYGREWLAVVEPLLRGRTGELFQGAISMSATINCGRRIISAAGRRSMSAANPSPAQDLVAASGDVWFLNGQPLGEVERLMASVGSRPRTGPPLRFGLSAFVIARETRSEAEAALAHLMALAEKDAAIRARQAANADPSVVMHHTHAAKTPRIGTNGGTAAGLVGSYDEVAARIPRLSRGRNRTLHAAIPALRSGDAPLRPRDLSARLGMKAQRGRKANPCLRRGNAHCRSPSAARRSPRSVRSAPGR